MKHNHKIVFRLDDIKLCNAIVSMGSEP